MRYELRTRFTVVTTVLVKGDVIDTSDKLLQVAVRVPSDEGNARV